MDAARQKRQRDADPHRFGLRRSVLAEAGVAVVLLVVTTVLTQTEPGRTEEEAKAAGASSVTGSASSTGAVTLDMPFDTGSQNGKGVLRVELDAARVGANDMHLYVERPDGTAFDIPEVKVALTQKAKDVGPLPVVPDHITTGHWSASGVQIPMAGDWEVAVTVRTSDIDQVTRPECSDRLNRTMADQSIPQARDHEATRSGGPGPLDSDGTATPGGISLAATARHRRCHRARPRRGGRRRRLRRRTLLRRHSAHLARQRAGDVSRETSARHHHAAAGPRPPHRLRPRGGCRPQGGRRAAAPLVRHGPAADGGRAGRNP
ncbi:hypothetical protein SVIOM342S_06410 [Streptomyces violaceorubidus]